MAQQKLYTEEQVREILKSTHIHTDNDVDMILPKFTPIELPSDEEINERSYYDKENVNLVVNAAQIARFRDGAKWMKEQILNQNK